MEALTIIVQWLHIVAAIMWVGGSMLLELGLRPVLERLPQSVERDIGRKVGRVLAPYFAVSGSATIVFGVLRGTLLGPIRSVSTLLSPYGIVWCIALVLAAALAVLGAVGVGRTTIRYYDADELWPIEQSPSIPGDSHEGDAGYAAIRPARLPQTNLIRRRLISYGRLQLAGFALILICMQLMSEMFGN